MTIRRFLRDTRGGATALAADAVTVMTVGGAALIIDHNWLVDQRDTLKAASDAAAVAATLEMNRLMDTQPGISDTALQSELEQVATRYVVFNLQHLSEERLGRAQSTLVVEVIPDRGRRTVDVSAQADLGGTLLSRHMPLLGNFTGPPEIRAEAGVESITNPVEVVLAIDISQSMERCVSGRSNRCAQPEAMRIAVVKRAAAKLVDILGPSADNQIAIGIVPWHMVVRLDDSTTRHATIGRGADGRTTPGAVTTAGPTPAAVAAAHAPPRLPIMLSHRRPPKRGRGVLTSTACKERAATRPCRRQPIS